MDKSSMKWWMLPRWTEEYSKGVDAYIEKAFANEAQGDEICCPCKVCYRRYWLQGQMVKDHMIAKGFLRLPEEEEEAQLVDSDEVHDGANKFGDNMYELLAKRPTEIPKEEFTDFLKYADSEYAKEISKKYQANRAQQGDIRTMGPRSYAVKRPMMQQNDPNKQCPPKAAVYMESRKRVQGRTYITQNEETLVNIERMRSLKSLDEGSRKTDPYFDVITKKEHNGRLRMHGLGVTKSSFKSKDVKTPFVLPQVFLDSITEQFNKRMEETLNYVISKIRQANPGVDIVIPDFPTNREDVSTSHDNVDMSDQD